MKQVLLTIIGILIIVAQPSYSTESTPQLPSALPGPDKHEGKPWYGFYPYLPYKREYILELGNMWEKQTLYWAGGKVGFHTGQCLGVKAESCQQYWDIIGGVGGRDGFTNGMLLTGPRWQLITYPKFYSPSISLVVGAMNISDEVRDQQVFAYGLGYGWTMAVHENLDLRIEGRVGYGDQVWSHFYVGLGLKLDNLVSFFADKIKGIGQGTLELTGKVIKGTGEVLKKVNPLNLKNDESKKIEVSP